MSMSRQALAGALSSPCSETPTHPSSPDPLKDLDLFTDNLLSLGQPTAPPKTVNRSSHRREKSGKSPGKTPFRKDYNEEYQNDKLWKKIAGLVDLPLPVKDLPLGTRNPKLETLFPQWEKSGILPGNKPLSEYIYEQSLIDNQCEKNPGTNVSR
jgi:hypothetical protein